MSEDQETYEVGYKKPPKGSRFKSGQSGNPKGRPRGVKNTDKLVLDVLNKKIPMNVNGEMTQVAMRTAIILAQAKKAIEKGDTRAGKLLLEMHDNAEKKVYRAEAVLEELIEALYEVFLVKAERDPEAAQRQLHQVLLKTGCDIKKLGMEFEPLRYEPTLQPGEYDEMPALFRSLDE